MSNFGQWFQGAMKEPVTEEKDGGFNVNVPVLIAMCLENGMTPNEIDEEYKKITGVSFITERERIKAALSEVTKINVVSLWMSIPNLSFNGKSVNDVISDGESHRVWEMIENLRSGVPV